MKILISLISEHLLPNVLLIKEMAGKWDKLVFITTERMGQLSMISHLCNALKIDKKDVQIVVVSEDDLPDAREKLDKCNFSKDDQYIINLTCGTKIMSIAPCFSKNNPNLAFIFSEK
jgi:vacuolar-type H+-ATPase subunit F/Vma7